MVIDEEHLFYFGIQERMKKMTTLHPFLFVSQLAERATRKGRRFRSIWSTSTLADSLLPYAWRPRRYHLLIAVVSAASR